jgi:NAD(P)-dependent dehydrogenase (short-subunit alcohol dehydrogenase family)
MKELAGKVAVVTGAASGIGFALSRRLGADGMKVMMADVEESALVSAAATLQAEGIDAAVTVTDVSDADAVDSLARVTVERFGAVHVVCNNAGVSGGGRAWQVPLPVWQWVVGVNLYGIVHGIRSFVPRLIEQGEGHVVNTASVAGLSAGPGSSVYSATKHAAVAVSEALYHDLAALGSPVGVSLLCPGFVRTRIHEADRNWPSSRGPMPSAPAQPGTADARRALREAIESGLDPAIVAVAVRDAIVDNRFWVLTHPELNGRILDRYRGAVEGIQPARMARD